MRWPQGSQATTIGLGGLTQNGLIVSGSIKGADGEYGLLFLRCRDGRGLRILDRLSARHGLAAQTYGKTLKERIVIPRPYSPPKLWEPILFAFALVSASLALDLALFAFVYFVLIPHL